MDGETTVFVVDDDSAARQSVVALVSLKGLKARGFASAEEFLAQYDPRQKGVVVADVRMAGLSGLDLLQHLRARHWSLPVVMITGYGDVPMAVRAMQAGAITFLEKPCQEQELWRGINLALEIEQTQHARRKLRAEIEARLASLTADEVTVLRRLLEGQPNKRIASDLDLGLRTIELRRSKVMKKMQAESLPDLVRMAIQVGFLKAEGGS
jgi:two-component system response regulator FixJ